MVCVSLYICISKDGFIGDKDGGVTWLPAMGPEAQAYYDSFLSSVQAIAMGSRSYSKILSFGMADWPYVGKESWVFTKRGEWTTPPTGTPHIHFTNESPEAFVERYVSAVLGDGWKMGYHSSYCRMGGECSGVSRVWLMGGAELTKSFADKNLIDEIMLFTVPKCIGEGIPLGVDLGEWTLVEESNLDPITCTIYRRSNIPS